MEDRSIGETSRHNHSSVQVIQAPMQASVIQSAITHQHHHSLSHQQNAHLQNRHQSNSAGDEEDDDLYARAKRDHLARRPSYKKILDDLSHNIPISTKIEEENSNSGHESNSENVHTSAFQTPSAILPSAMLHLNNQAHRIQSIASYSPNTVNHSDAPTILQYTPDNTPYFISPSALAQCNDHPHDVTRKRELRLLKNREAARECRRKKKEYVKCLENRVDVLETQNKTLIEELKSLKELYTQKDMQSNSVQHR